MATSGRLDGKRLYCLVFLLAFAFLFVARKGDYQKRERKDCRGNRLDAGYLRRSYRSAHVCVCVRVCVCVCVWMKLTVLSFDV